MGIVRLSRLSWPVVRAALTLYEQGGWQALKPKARGKESGNGRMLTAEQEHVVRGIICDKRPEQMKMDFALWNRGAVSVLIEYDHAPTLARTHSILFPKPPRSICRVETSPCRINTYLYKWQLPYMLLLRHDFALTDLEVNA